MNSSGCYIDSQGLRAAGKYLFPGFCRPGIFRFAGIFRVLWISHRNIRGSNDRMFSDLRIVRVSGGRLLNKGRRHVCARIWKRSRATACTPPLPRRICRMRLLRSHADIRLPAHRGGRCCCSTMANEKSQPIINQLRFYFRVPRTIFENCNFIPFVNTLIISYFYVYCKDNQHIVFVNKIA